LRTNSSNFALTNFSRSILLNRGNATFVDASELFHGKTISGVAAGDIDRDGRIDLVTMPSSGEVRTFRSAKAIDLQLFAD
jgi:hypothetical protein